MSSTVATLVLWSAILAVVAGQVGILLSTQRAWRRSAAPVPFMERIFAWAPALALIGVLYLAWAQATRPPIIEIQIDPATREIRL